MARQEVNTAKLLQGLEALKTSHFGVVKKT